MGLPGRKTVIQVHGYLGPCPLVGLAVPGDDDLLSNARSCSCMWPWCVQGWEHGRKPLLGRRVGKNRVASRVLADGPQSDSICSLDSLSENKIGDEGVAQLSATFPQLKALETLK